jgi:transposase InsO family protein
MLGFEVAQSTVSKYMVRGRSPSQCWKTFFRNHAQAIAAIDLFVVPTLTFERLFAVLVLGHDRRQLLWFEVTRHPTAEWLARQITEAFPWASAPTYLVRDNDRAYGHAFRSRVRAMGIRDRPISPGSPWQNPYVERLIGTVRRECLDGMLVFGEAHLRQILSSLCCVLQRGPHALGAEQGCAPRSGSATDRGRCSCPNLVWPAPPLRSEMIFGKHNVWKAIEEPGGEAVSENRRVEHPPIDCWPGEIVRYRNFQQLEGPIYPDRSSYRNILFGTMARQPECQFLHRSPSRA